MIVSHNSTYNIQWISISRAISIVFIIIFHIYMGKLRYIFYEGTNVFFALSGYVIALSLMKKTIIQKVDWLRWGGNRLLRLYPLWLIVLFIALLANIFNIGWINLNMSSSNTVIDFVSHVFLLHVFSSSTYYSINIAWWFQGIILQCYLFTPLFFYLVSSKSSGFPLVLTCWSLFIGANLFFRIFAPDNKLLMMYIGQAAAGWLWYLMGMIYALKYSTNSSTNQKTLHFSFSIFIISVAYAVVYFSSAKINSLGFILAVLNTIAVVCIIIMMSQFFALLSNKNGILKQIPLTFSWLGSFSYSAYLIHMFFIPILVLPLPWLLRIASYFFTVFLASYLLTHTENKLKVLLKI